MKLKSLIVTIVLFFIVASAKSQTDNADRAGQLIEITDPKTGKITKVKIFGNSIDTTKIALEVNPEYPGGMTRFQNFLKSNVIYPREAKINKIKGDVKASFIIDSDGSVRDVKIIQGIGGGCDEELARVINSSRNGSLQSGEHNTFFFIRKLHSLSNSPGPGVFSGTMGLTKMLLLSDQ